MRIFLISWFLAYSFIGTSQDKQNVFIQSNPSELFYVEVSGDTLSSNSEGFVLFPASESMSSLIVTFPHLHNTQFKFNFEEKNINGGYFLQQTKENTWQLIDLANQTIFKGIKVEIQPTISNSPSPLAFDIFSTQLANAVNDQDVRDISSIIKTEKNQFKTISNTTNTKNNNKSTVSEVKLIYQDGNKMVFVDQTKKQIDTITITFDNKEAESSLALSKPDSISNNSLIKVEEQNKAGLDSLPYKEGAIKFDAVSIEQKVNGLGNQQNLRNINADSSAIVSNPTNVEIDSTQLEDRKMLAQPQVKDSSSIEEAPQLFESKKKFGKFIPVDAITKNQINTIDTNATVSKTNLTVNRDTLEKVKSSIKVGCKVEANERDLILFRRKMILMNNQKELLFFASKEFKQKCYTTLLIRNLSFIFLNDSDKFQFFKLAYSNVVDPENFGTLERFLNDEPEILNFRKLINKQ
jgi:hypothetical protein